MQHVPEPSQGAALPDHAMQLGHAAMQSLRVWVELLLAALQRGFVLG